MKIVAEIPARYGSKRMPHKNLCRLAGRPLITYAINAAKQAKTIHEIYVNTENNQIGQIAIDNGIRYYKRDPKLAGDTVTSDEFNYDFMKNVKADIVVMVNPVAPLITGRDIDEMVGYFLKNDLDTLIPVREERLHAFCEGKPVNFNPNGRLPMTQNIEPVKICVWTVCIWKRRVFMKTFEEKGCAVFSGKMGFYPQKGPKSIKISTEDDFVLAELLAQTTHRWSFPRVLYDSEIAGPDYPAMWMDEIRYIEKLLLEQAGRNDTLHVLEWGSGRGTVYFSKFLKKHNIKFTWAAIENFIPWHEIVVSMIKDAVLENTVCFLKSPTREENKAIQETLDMTEFLNFPATLGRKFHLILVDARKREECLETAPKLLAPRGVVALHDAERQDHQGALKLYKNGGNFVCAHESPVPGGVQKLWTGYLE